LGNQTNLSTRDAFAQNQLALIRTACPFFVSPTTIDLVIDGQHLIIDLAYNTVTWSSLMDIIWEGKGYSFVPTSDKHIRQRKNYLEEGIITEVSRSNGNGASLPFTDCPDYFI
jgi:hypothetical protein